MTKMTYFRKETHCLNGKYYGTNRHYCSLEP